jgi:hypothetical protein
MKPKITTDIEAELSAILSAEIAKSIDREIFKSLGIDLDKKDRRIKSINKIFKL